MRFLYQYNNGIPEGSRLAVQTEQQFKDTAARLQTTDGQAMIEKVKALSNLAEQGTFQIGCCFLNYQK